MGDFSDNNMMSASAMASAFGAGALGRRGGGYYGPENNTTFNRAPRNPVNLGNQQHEVVRSQKRVLGNRRRALRRMAYLSEQYQKTIWAQITPNWGSAASLSKNLEYLTVEGQSNRFPMFAWNISDLPVGYVDANITYNIPHYQLAQSSATGLYFWSSTVGNNQIGADIPGSQYVRNTAWYGVTDAGSTPGKQPHWIHDHTGVSIIFQGATTRQTTQHIMVCEFDNAGVGPRRENYASAVGYSTFDDAESVDTVASASSFWDKFWSKKVNNPIYNPNIISDGQRHMRVLARDTISIGPESTFNEDTRGRTVQKKYFYQFGQIHNGVDPSEVQTYGRNNFIGTGQPFQTNVVSQYGPRNASRLNGEYSKTRWLVVYGDVSVLGAFDSAKNASFDIVLTNKHTVKN